MKLTPKQYQILKAMPFNKPVGIDVMPKYTQKKTIMSLANRGFIAFRYLPDLNGEFTVEKFCNTPPLDLPIWDSSCVAIIKKVDYP